MTAEGPVIVTEGLTKRYGDFTAVDGLDLSLRHGEVFGLLGPNGAGKTTTILMLLGLTEPSEGRAMVAGHDPVREPLAVKSTVGYLPDNVGFYPNLTGRQNLRFTASLNGMRGAEVEEHLTGLLDLVGLGDAADKAAGKYSRGMRQRLGIADALVKRPRILILDEPTIGIDPEGVRELLHLIVDLSHNQGITILLSSHLLYQVQAVCDRVGIFVRGRLIAVGPVETLGRQLGGVSGFDIEVGVVEAGSESVAGGPDRAGTLSPSAAERPGDGAVAGEAGAPRPGAPVHEAEVRAALEGLDGIRSLSWEHDAWLIRADRDLRSSLAAALTSHGLLPVHLRLRGQGLDDIYGHYFEQEVRDTDA